MYIRPRDSSTQTDRFRGAILAFGLALLLAGPGASIGVVAQSQFDFDPPVHYTSDPVARVVRAFDLDGDGDQDVVVTGGNTTSYVGVFINPGDGTFGASQRVPVGRLYPNGVDGGDLDGDGDVDLVVGFRDSPWMTVLLNNGDATFDSPRRYFIADPGLPTSFYNAVELDDLDGDGDLDVALGIEGRYPQYLDSRVAVLFNQGDGSFGGRVNLVVGRGISDLGAGDLDGDGDGDIVAITWRDGLVQLIRSNGDGTFAAPEPIFIPGVDNPFNVLIADMNGGGVLDVVVLKRRRPSPGAPIVGSVWVLPNRGDGTFDTAIAGGGTGGDAQAGAVADLDLDGDLDLAAINFSRATLGFLANEGTGLLQLAQTQALGSQPLGVAAADLNGDGVDDILIGLGSLTVLLNRASPPNSPPTADAGATQTLECAGPLGTAVTLDGSGSSDPEGDELTYEWTENGTPLGTGETLDVDLGLGTSTITLTVSDPSGLSDSTEVVVTIEDTTPPAIACPATLTVEQDSASRATVILPITATDTCGMVSIGSTPASGSVFPLGTTSVTATATDEANLTDGCAFDVTVVPPATTEGAKVMGGGAIAAGDGEATFGLVAQAKKNGTPQGNMTFQDHALGITVKSTMITAVVVTDAHARIFGRATLGNEAVVDFVVDVDDLGEPGIGVDRFRIELSNGDAAGSSTLAGGNIQIH